MPAQQSLLGRKWPTPIAKPLYPWAIAGGLVAFGIWKLQGAMMDSEEYKNDPRNPNAKKPT